MLDIKDKLEELYKKYQDLEGELSRPDVVADLKRFKKLSQEYAHLKEIAQKFLDWKRISAEIVGHKDLLRSEKDADILTLIKDELPELEERYDLLREELRVLLLPHDPMDDKNAILEIRAGTGGDEAALFAGEVFRMYSRYAELRGWKVEVISSSAQEGGGMKEVVAEVKGSGVYGRLKYEGGVHRVQRVPVTEAQGRVHTSAITVAVLPEADEIEDYPIDEKDLKIDTYRASGAGGQHVNKTDSAIRITHVPTGIVVAMQEERSQIQNRIRAMALLRSKLLQAEIEKRDRETAAQRKTLVGSGDRSEKIRTYNFPQNRCTDHRIGITLYRLGEIMEGSLDMVIDPLITFQNAELLKSSLS